jgi:putative oxidoreductase
MTDAIATKFRDPLLLIARVLFMVLFLIAGLEKAEAFSGTVAYFTKIHTPLPELATIISILVELPIAIAVVLGWQTRWLALILIPYTLGSAYFGHQYWTAEGPAYTNLLYHFYKNVSICGGFIVLFVAGAGRFSIDAIIAPRPKG